MTETNTLIATVLLLFGGSMIISYCVTWYLSSRAHHVKLAANIPVRLIGEGGTYRCHFLRSDGDMLIFTTNFRPIKGTKGYYRVNMKHGVSEVRTGIRHTLGIIFHDATS